jgi:uncharacterized membrane protein
VPNLVYRFATVSGQSVQWFLKRNCSITPAQLGWLYASLCVVSLGIGSFFWAHGATLVLPFAWVELIVVGVAFLAYARHATDGERISLQGAQLVVELENAGRLERAEFNREWVRVEPTAGDRSLIEVSGRGRCRSGAMCAPSCVRRWRGRFGWPCVAAEAGAAWLASGE